MFRWDEIASQELYGMTVKMYRDPFVPKRTQKAVHKNLELDHYAYLYLGSELFMYRILDTNWELYMEARGDVSRIENVLIPMEEDSARTTF
jgi:hypothetical protein